MLLSSAHSLVLCWQSTMLHKGQSAAAPGMADMVSRCCHNVHPAGEEAKVILVSLVRSNDQGSAGFLSESNRINVLLSRWQLGNG